MERKKVNELTIVSVRVRGEPIIFVDAGKKNENTSNKKQNPFDGLGLYQSHFLLLLPFFHFLLSRLRGFRNSYFTCLMGLRSYTTISSINFFLIFLINRSVVGRMQFAAILILFFFRFQCAYTFSRSFLFCLEAARCILHNRKRLSTIYLITYAN